MNNVVKVLQKTTNCVAKKCREEQQELAKQHEKYLQEIAKLISEKGRNAKKEQKLKNLTLKFYKNQERMKLLDCQLKKCYKQTDNLLKKTLSTVIDTKDNSPSLIKHAQKYQRIFKNKITAKDLNQYDIDSLKMVGLV